MGPCKLKSRLLLYTDCDKYKCRSQCSDRIKKKIFFLLWFSVYGGVFFILYRNVLNLNLCIMWYILYSQILANAQPYATLDDYFALICWSSKTWGVTVNQSQYRDNIHLKCQHKPTKHYLYTDIWESYGMRFCISDLVQCNNQGLWVCFPLGSWKAQILIFKVPSFQTHYVAFCCLPKQTSKCDDRGHAGAVEEQDGG